MKRMLVLGASLLAVGCSGSGTSSSSSSGAGGNNGPGGASASTSNGGGNGGGTGTSSSSGTWSCSTSSGTCVCMENAPASAAFPDTSCTLPAPATCSYTQVDPSTQLTECISSTQIPAAQCGLVAGQGGTVVSECPPGGSGSGGNGASSNGSSSNGSASAGNNGGSNGSASAGNNGGSNGSASAGNNGGSNGNGGSSATTGTTTGTGDWGCSISGPTCLCETDRSASSPATDCSSLGGVTCSYTAPSPLDPGEQTCVSSSAISQADCAEVAGNAGGQVVASCPPGGGTGSTATSASAGNGGANGSNGTSSSAGTNGSSSSAGTGGSGDLGYGAGSGQVSGSNAFAVAGAFKEEGVDPNSGNPTLRFMMFDAPMTCAQFQSRSFPPYYGHLPDGRLVYDNNHDAKNIYYPNGVPAVYWTTYEDGGVSYFYYRTDGSQAEYHDISLTGFPDTAHIILGSAVSSSSAPVGTGAYPLGTGGSSADLVGTGVVDLSGDDAPTIDSLASSGTLNYTYVGSGELDGNFNVQLSSTGEGAPGWGCTSTDNGCACSNTATCSTGPDVTCSVTACCFTSPQSDGSTNCTCSTQGGSICDTLIANTEGAQRVSACPVPNQPLRTCGGGAIGSMSASFSAVPCSGF